MSQGKTDCPLCGAECDHKLTKKGKGYLTCGECGTQLFARGEVANLKLREKTRQPPAAPAPAAAPAAPANPFSLDKLLGF